MISKKLDQVLFKIWKYTFFIFEKGDQQKIGQDFLRIVSIHFLIFEKGEQQRIGPSFFECCKFTSYNI